ncbi:MAG: hypothetical protein OXS33_12690 [bacterium]|nr:hypothetical protein [bacterium]
MKRIVGFHIFIIFPLALALSAVAPAVVLAQEEATSPGCADAVALLGGYFEGETTRAEVDAAVERCAAETRGAQGGSQGGGQGQGGSVGGQGQGSTSDGLPTPVSVWEVFGPGCADAVAVLGGYFEGEAAKADVDAAIERCLTQARGAQGGSVAGGQGQGGSQGDGQGQGGSQGDGQGQDFQDQGGRGQDPTSDGLPTPITVTAWEWHLAYTQAPRRCGGRNMPKYTTEMFNQLLTWRCTSGRWELITKRPYPPPFNEIQWEIPVGADGPVCERYIKGAHPGWPGRVFTRLNPGFDEEGCAAE